MNRIKCLLITFLCICALHSSAQLLMQFNAARNATPFRVSYGDALVYEVIIINGDSSNSFSGNVYAGFLGSKSVAYDSVLIGSFSLGASDTVEAVISIDVVPEYFKEGPEVVVVWPIFNGEAGYQLADFVFIRGNLSSVSDGAEDAHFFIANSRFYWDGLSVEQVKIFAMNGQLVFQALQPAESFPVPDLPKGIYIVGVLTASNRLLTSKHLLGK